MNNITLKNTNIKYYLIYIQNIFYIKQHNIIF